MVMLRPSAILPNSRSTEKEKNNSFYRDWPGIDIWIESHPKLLQSNIIHKDDGGTGYLCTGSFCY